MNATPYSWRKSEHVVCCIRVIWTMSRINGNQTFVNLGLFCVFEFVVTFTSCMLESKLHYLENYVIRKCQLGCCRAICSAPKGIAPFFGMYPFQVPLERYRNPN